MANDTKKPSAFQSILAGGVAGGAESLITYPTEYIKTKQQLATKSGKQASPIRLLIQTLKQNGARSLYTGAGTFCVSNSSKSAVRFATFDFARNRLPRDPQTGKMSVIGNMLAGACAGIAESVTVLTPGENVKTKMIDSRSSASGKVSTSSWQVTKRIVAAEGVLGLYRGLVPVTLKQSANAVVRFTSYHFFLEHVGGYLRAGDNKPSPLAPAVCGGLAGVFTVYCTMPFDVVKTQMQAVGASDAYRGSFHCLRSLVATKGVQALWNGTTPRLVRLSVSGLLSFSIYEQVIVWTEKPRIQTETLQTRNVVQGL